MSAQGEKNFSSEGMEVQKFDRTPIKVGDYAGVLKSSGASVKSAQDAGSVPYVGGVYIDVLNTGVGEGQNKRVYWSAYLSLKPGKDGKVNPQRGNGLVALARAFGEELRDIPVRTMSAAVKVYDKATGRSTPTGELEETDVLDARAVAEWLKERDGKELKFRSKLRPDRDGNKMAEVDYFIEADPSEVASFGELEVEEEASPPPPPPAKKGAPSKAAPKRR